MTTADPPAPPTPWCTYETAAAAAALGTDPVHGLSTAEAGARFVRIGANALPEGTRMSAAALLGLTRAQQERGLRELPPEHPHPHPLSQEELALLQLLQPQWLHG